MNNDIEHLIRFYPVGNGDTTKIILHNGKRILVDFYHSTDGENDDHPKIDLKKTIKSELDAANRDYLDVVIFTHGDEDHTKGSADFFEFYHVDKYKGDGRIKINMLYVPAAMILESRNEIHEDFRVIQAEARHRLKKGKGILVFSKPDKLKKWLKDNDLSLEQRMDCIIDAGNVIPTFSIEKDLVEFFVHAPLIKHVDDNVEIERNEAAIIIHATFEANNNKTRYFMIGDSEHEVLEDIVHYTENGIHKDKKRLEWDIYNIPHHCSYLALNSRGEKGEIETIPKEKIDKLLSYGNLYSTLISSSHTITEDYEKPQPPHIQAHNCYVKYNKKNNGRGIFVTMEYPNKEKPEPIEIAINKNGHYFTDFSDKEEYIEKYTKNINLSFDLKIECEIIQDGFRKNILSKIPFLRTDKKLRFFIESTNVPKPYSVKWKVKNKGLQARKLKQLRGEITDDDGHEEKIEHTKYIGSHYVECYILKGNVCVAKDRIEVPIKL